MLLASRATPSLLLLASLALVACGGTVDDGSGGAGAGGAGGGADACQEANDCPSSAGNPACSYLDGLCGELQGKRCTETGASCGESPYATFCACDGGTFAAPKSCVTQVDARPGACAPPAERFYCGALDCALGADFCDLSYGTASCASIPGECAGAADLCLCLGYDGSGGCECTAFADGHVEVGCYL